MPKSAPLRLPSSHAIQLLRCIILSSMVVSTAVQVAVELLPRPHRLLDLDDDGAIGAREQGHAAGPVEYEDFVAKLASRFAHEGVLYRQ